METINTSWDKHGLPPLNEFKNKRIIVRVDWNMPVIDGVITDTSRFDVSVPFLTDLSFVGAKIILLTHFGEKGESLEVIASHVTKNLPFVSFNPSLDFSLLENSVNNLKNSEGLLLENVRMWKGEEDNTPSLARSFASLGDFFINDAFSVSHREHASVVGVASLLLSYFGPTFMRELIHLSKILKPEKPALLIVGGAKISTKLSLIQRYLEEGVRVFVGGAMVHNIWKQKGLEIGNSFYDSKSTIVNSLITHPLLITPVDVVLSTGETVSINEIPKDGEVVDCGEKTTEMLKEVIGSSKTIIANGPLGLYEKGWLHGSEKILNNVAESTAQTYIGGGDTVAVANSLHLLRKFTFVSLGGGAMLNYLASGTLPGIDAVTKS